MIFDKYPYTNFHEMNDDWIIQTLREFGQRLDEFVAANQLTYADPIEYNPSTTYPKNTVVIDNDTAYVSKQAVPAGIQPAADSEYWLVIFPFGDLIDGAVEDMQAEIDAALAAANEQLQAAIDSLPATVDAWMTDHPDVTTTVPLYSINWQKLSTETQAVILADYIKAPESQEIIFTEQGGLYNGAEYATPAYCRTGFLHLPVGIATFACAVGYLVRIYRYDADGTFIDYTDVGFGTTQSTIGYTAIAVAADEQYRFTITINGGTALAPADIPFAAVLYNLYTERHLPDLNDKLTALEVVGSAASTDGLPYQSLLPAHWFAMESNPESYAESDTYLDGIIRDAIDGKHLIYVTDTHYPENSHISQELQQYVRSKINIERVVFGGDILNRNDTPYIAYQTMVAYFNKCVSAFGASYLPAFGNHDLNTANTPDAAATRMDIGVVSDLYTKHLAGYVHFEESKDYGAVTGDNMLGIMRTIVDHKISADPTIPATLGMTRDEIVDALLKYNRLHYYVDDDVNKTRYIIFNTGAPDNIVVSTIFGVINQGEIHLQVNWMYETLMSTPVGYDVVLCGHEATTDPRVTSETYISVNSHYNIVGQLSCLKMKAKMNTRLASATAAAINPDWMPNSTFQTLDFADAPDVGKIVLFVGHWHRDYAVKGFFFRAASGSGGAYSPYDYRGSLIESGSVINESNGEILIVGTTADKNKTTLKVPLTGVDEDAIDIVTLASDTIEFKRIGHSWIYSDGDDPGTHTEPITRTFTIT